MTTNNIKQSTQNAAVKSISSLVHFFNDPYEYTDNHGVIVERNHHGYPQAEIAGNLAWTLRNLADNIANSTLPKQVDMLKAMQDNLNDRNVDAALRKVEYIQTLEEQLAMLVVLADEAERVYTDEVDQVSRERRDSRFTKRAAERNATPIDDAELRAKRDAIARVTDKYTAGCDANSHEVSN